MRSVLRKNFSFVKHFFKDKGVELDVLLADDPSPAGVTVGTFWQMVHTKKGCKRVRVDDYKRIRVKG